MLKCQDKINFLMQKIKKRTRADHGGRSHIINHKIVFLTDSYRLRSSSQYLPLVLSSFALVWMIGVFVQPSSHDTPTTFAESANINQANGGPENSTATLSLGAPSTIDGISDQSSTDISKFTVGRGVTAYQTRTVSLEAKHIRNYKINLSGDPELTNNKYSDTVSTITTETGAGNDIPSNSWGYYYGTNSITANKNQISFKPIPATSAEANLRQLDSGKANDDGSVAAGSYNRNLIFAANFDADRPDGEYKSSNMVLSLTVEPQEYITYSITYNNNGGGTVPANPSTSGYDLDHATFQLESVKRDHYVFKGWNTDQAKANNGEVSYQSGDSVTLCNDSSAKNITCTFPNTRTQPMYAVWEGAYKYTLSFNLNGGDVNAAFNPQSYGPTADTSHTFTISGQPTRLNYTFQGWATSQERANAGTIDYQPTATSFTLTSSSQSVILWAVWKSIAPTVDGFGSNSFSITKMQDMSSSVCNSVSNGTSGSLYDIRDNKVYDIQKLGDSKCWMVSNLALELSDFVGTKTLTADNSDVTRTWASTTGASAIWDDTTDNPIKYYNGSNSDNWRVNYGYYYSWCAATAGICPSSGEVSSSICPKGWRLPTVVELAIAVGNASNVGDATSHADGNYVNVSSGNITSKWYLTGSHSSAETGTYGYYWSNVPAAINTANYLRIGGRYLNALVNLKSIGYAIRCVAK